MSYFKDPETLEELDKTGLPIGTTSVSLHSMFGDDDHPVIRSLVRKFIIITKKIPVINRTAFERDICCIERYADIKVIIAVMPEYLIRYLYEIVIIFHFRLDSSYPMEHLYCTPLKNALVPIM